VWTDQPLDFETFATLVSWDCIPYSDLQNNSDRNNNKEETPIETKEEEI